MTQTIAHIINPVVVNKHSDLHVAQPVTFESMRLAKIHAQERVAVELYSAQFPEDAGLVPEWINRTRDLDRSILDVGSFQEQRKLPLLRDILERLYDASEADYFIYTNVDIALMPHFYTTIAQLIETGVDAMVINRRTIAKIPADPDQIEFMWAQAGEKHPGHDCFVFPRKWLPGFAFDQVCVGVAWVGRTLLWNLCAHAKHFQEFKDLHLTFHLGNDKVWKDQRYADYENHNRVQAAAALEQITGRYGPFAETSSIWPYLTPAQQVPGEPVGVPGKSTKGQVGLLKRLLGRK